MIKFAYTIFYVKDVERTLHFYETAFQLQRRFLSPEGDYGELHTEGTTLSFCSLALAKSNLSKGFAESDLINKPFAMEIGFTTPDVEGTLKQAIAAGAILEEAAKTKPWGQVVAYVRDINGFLIEICTPMG